MSGNQKPFWLVMRLDCQCLLAHKSLSEEELSRSNTNWTGTDNSMVCPPSGRGGLWLRVNVFQLTDMMQISEDKECFSGWMFNWSAWTHLCLVIFDILTSLAIFHHGNHRISCLYVSVSWIGKENSIDVNNSRACASCIMWMAMVFTCACFCV